jgi:hypothetical protein
MPEEDHPKLLPGWMPAEMTGNFTHWRPRTPPPSGTDPSLGEQILGCDPGESVTRAGARDAGRSKAREERWMGRGQPRRGGSSGGGGGNPRWLTTRTTSISSSRCGLLLDANCLLLT